MIKKVTEEHRIYEQYREKSVCKMGGYAEMALTMMGEQSTSRLDEIGEILACGKSNDYHGKDYFSYEDIQKFIHFMKLCSDSFNETVQEYERENDIDRWEAA